MKLTKGIFGIMLVLLMVLVTSLPVSADMTPPSITATLAPGESVVTTKTVTVPDIAPQADVVFAFDLTGSMGGIIGEVKLKAGEIMTKLAELVTDIEFGVMSYMDYPAFYSSCGYSATYGWSGPPYNDYAYSLDQAITSNTGNVSNAINGLVIGSGWDDPEAYGRVFYESYADFIGETNPTHGPVGWRIGSKKILVNFGDNVPHDCDLNEGVTSGTWSTGSDPGRDGIIGTADDIDLQLALAGMATYGVILLECHTTTDNSTHWTYWTEITGGGFYETTSDNLTDDVVAAVTEGLTIPVVNGLHLEVTTPGFETWLTSVSPSKYDSVNPGESRDFEETITVPGGTAAGVYTFTVSALDDKEVSYGEQEVTITVPDINNPPVADNDTATTSINTPVDIDVMANDSDPDGDTLTITHVSDPPSGTAVISDNSTPTDPGDDFIIYTPDTDFTGYDSFIYIIEDGRGGSDNATVTITVNPLVNNPPVANDDTATTDEDTSLNVSAPGVLANDTDVENDPLTAILVAGPSHGILAFNSDGSFSYTPSLNYNGTDNFTYKANDGHDNSNVATVTITINPVNDAPVADITEIDDETVELPVTIKVTPQTLNLKRLGKWVNVHVCGDSENTPQQVGITLDGSGSFDPDGDPLTYDWTLTGPEGDIPVLDNVISQVVLLSDGDYTVTLVVNDGTVDSAPDTDTFTLTDMTIDDLTSVDPSEFTLNGVPASDVKGGGRCLVISFKDDAIAATVEVGEDVEMKLEGPVSGVDYIDVK